jgi:TPR repeat protein
MLTTAADKIWTPIRQINLIKALLISIVLFFTNQTNIFAETEAASESKLDSETEVVAEERVALRLFDWNTVRRIPRIEDPTFLVEHWTETVRDLVRNKMLGEIAPSYALLEIELQTCGGGNPRLCYLDGIAAMKRRDTTAAATFFARGCRGKYGPACLATAKHNESSEGVIFALKSYESACDMGMSHGCVRAAQIRQDNGQYDYVLAMISRSCFLGSETHCAGNGAVLTPSLITMMAQSTPQPKVIASPVPKVIEDIPDVSVNTTVPDESDLKNVESSVSMKVDIPKIEKQNEPNIEGKINIATESRETPATIAAPSIAIADMTADVAAATQTTSIPTAVVQTKPTMLAKSTGEQLRDAMQTPHDAKKKLTSCGALEVKECLAKAEEYRFEGDTENALKLLTQLCDREMIEGCNQLAILEQKNGNRKRALILFAKNCKLGHAQSCINSGDNDADVGEPFDAITKYKLACKMGAPVGCLKAATYQDANLSVDEKKTMLESACRGGLTLACSQFAAMTKSEDPSRVFELQKSNCERGSSEDCMEASKFAKDYAKHDDANKLLAKACSLGEDMACLQSAKQVAQSNLTPEDKVKKTLTNCEKIDAKDCMHKGDLLREEIGEDAVLPVYQLACSKGGAAACIRLADFDYSRGRINDSRLWHERACEFGAVASCVSAAAFFEGEQKNDRAVALYMLACKLKDGKGCYRGGNLAKQLGMTKEANDLLQEACKFGFGWDCDNGVMAH